MSDDGFLSRWAKRKAEAKSGVAPAPEPPQLPVIPALRQAQDKPGFARAGIHGGEPVSVDPGFRRDDDFEAAAPQQSPPPTMEDAAALEPGADIKRFLAPQVDESVKRAALKKLFTDPHFNLMDGLDTYIDDYGKPDPIPEAMLRRMAQSDMLGLFAEETQDPSPPKASPDGALPPAVPQSPPPQDPQAVPPDEDPDLRLQQDDAAGRGGAGEGPPA